MVSFVLAIVEVVAVEVEVEVEVSLWLCKVKFTQCLPRCKLSEGMNEWITL